MELRLRDENLKVELMKQRAIEEMRESKLIQLDDIAAATRRELIRLEQSRLEMQREMDQKTMEVQLLQQELRSAEENLKAPAGIISAFLFRLPFYLSPLSLSHTHTNYLSITRLTLPLSLPPAPPAYPSPSTYSSPLNRKAIL
jgi:hypothetical protein